MSAAATFGRGLPRAAPAARGTWRGWAAWLWQRLVEFGEARARARLARGHWR
jgi:hypothetical protein